MIAPRAFVRVLLGELLVVALVAIVGTAMVAGVVAVIENRDREASR